MNERIKQLWTQGTFNVVPRAGDYSSVSAEQIEKFAELIVRECAECLNINKFDKPRLTPEGPIDYLQNNTIDMCYHTILKHFGVEE